MYLYERYELTKWIKSHPITVILILVIWYLSLFTPPKIELANVRFIDKWAHLLMYGSLAFILWTEDWRARKTFTSMPRALPLHRPGSHEWPHRIGTSLLHHQPERRLARLGRQCHRCIVRHSVWWHSHPENAQESIARRTLRLRAPILPAKVYTDRYEDGNCSNDGHLLLPVR